MIPADFLNLDPDQNHQVEGVLGLAPRFLFAATAPVSAAEPGDQDWILFAQQGYWGGGPSHFLVAEVEAEVEVGELVDVVVARMSEMSEMSEVVC